jgi:hypothetical protein
MKTNPPLRRSILGLVVFGVVNSVKAFMIEFGLIITGGGIIVGSLYYLGVSVTSPATDREQQLAQQYGPVGGKVQTGSGAGINMALVGWQIGLYSMPLDVVNPPAVSSIESMPSSPASGFTLQYGMAYDTNRNMTPWIGSPPDFVSSNTPVQSAKSSVVCDTLYSTTNSCYFTVSVDGLTWCFFGDDLEAGNYTYFWIGKQTVTIERTTDFVDWTPIFTNAACQVNAAQFFTDTNAPADRGFYRVLTQ